MDTAFELPTGYELRLIAPEKDGEDDKPCWRLLIKGTPDPKMVTEGVGFSPDLTLSGLCSQLRSLLYNTISSSVVDETWASIIQPRVKALYDRAIREPANREVTTFVILSGGGPALTDLFERVPVIEQSIGTDDEADVCKALMDVVGYTHESLTDEGDLWTLLKGMSSDKDFFDWSGNVWNIGVLNDAIEEELAKMSGK